MGRPRKLYHRELNELTLFLHECGHWLRRLQLMRLLLLLLCDHAVQRLHRVH